MSNEQSVDELEQILLEDPHVIEIRHDEHWDALRIDLALWEVKFHEYLRWVEQFLHSPYIIDNFERDHTQRRIWESELGKRDERFIDYLDNQALGYGNVSGVRQFVSRVPHYYKREFTEAKEKRQSILDMIPIPVSKYNSLSTEQKVDLVRNVKQELYELLQILSN